MVVSLPTNVHACTHAHTHTHKTSATLSGLIFRVELIDIKQRLLRYMDQIFTEASLSNDSRLLANVPYLTTPPQGHRPSLPLGSDAWTKCGAYALIYVGVSIWQLGGASCESVVCVWVWQQLLCLHTCVFYAPLQGQASRSNQAQTLNVYMCVWETDMVYERLGDKIIVSLWWRCLLHHRGQFNMYNE